MSKACVLFSGGLDSTTLLARTVEKYGRDNVVALSLSYGQKHSKELECAEQVARYYGVERVCFDVSKVFEGSSCSLLAANGDVPEGEYSEQLKEMQGRPVSTYVPFRNGLFLAIAASVALSRGCEVIYYGAHRDDAAGNAYPDCSTEFAWFMSEAIAWGTGKQIRMAAPFISWTKADIVHLGTELGVPYELTWSCYNGGDKPCGKCGTCLDRIKAFELNGLKDPLEY